MAILLSPPDRSRPRLPRAARVVVAVGLGLLTAGCATGLAHRRPGSDITLRDTATRRALQMLAVPCDRNVDTVSTAARAKDVADCERPNADSVAVNDPQRTKTSPKVP